MKDSPNDKITVSNPQTVNDANHGPSNASDSYNGTMNTIHQKVVTHLNQINAEVASRESHEESSLSGIKPSARVSLSPTNSA